MKDVNQLSSSFEQLGLAQEKPRHEKKNLGQDDFLKLMTTQMNNQDPFKPMENGDFLGQMAQFSAVTGLKEIKESFNTLASSMKSAQALQASSMVGRKVLIPGDKAALDGSGMINGAVDVPAGSGDIKVMVTNMSGEVVKEIALNGSKSGLIEFSWDGKQLDDQQAAPGTYFFNAVVPNQEQNKEGSASLKTYVMDSVKSVSLGKAGEGVVLNLASSGKASMADVAEVR